MEVQFDEKSYKAFNQFEDNKVVADEHAIVMGASHIEPMLRNNMPGAGEDTMADLSVYPKNKRFIDLSNSGKGKVKWKAECETKGNLKQSYLGPPESYNHR